MCVCPPPSPLITSHVKDTRNNWIMNFYSYYVSLYDTAINKLNRRGLSNTVDRERLPKKTKVTQLYLQKDYQAVPTSRSISITYKGEWVNA